MQLCNGNWEFTLLVEKQTVPDEGIITITEHLADDVI